MAVAEALANALDKAYETKPLKEVIKASPSALEGVSEGDAELLQKAFGIKTIEDFATCKFVLTAQALVNLSKLEK